MKICSDVLFDVFTFIIHVLQNSYKVKGVVKEEISIENLWSGNIILNTSKEIATYNYGFYIINLKKRNL
ncbi:hypothetical protein SAMN04487765_2235 [Tenacibaculum sp. MAR_2010_89]|uniref:hypothetical protein n=1 Tax=Tenacibaculum sp. MAR_2010_89 TaxID=1250198 RepID=UPI00089B7DEA|nr:hypothetical protein [Tenacibaculum sp. MAR_2010_89]SEE35039.1 hypothetical protein SAMN04487765_2235 [Tenacibaculum sp. MAR_2010_89]